MKKYFTACAGILISVLLLMGSPLRIHAQADRVILYEEDFNAYDGQTAVPDALADPDLPWGNLSGNLKARLDDGVMTVTGGGTHAYFELTLPGSEDWSNYTLEYDGLYDCDTALYWGMVFNGTDSTQFQKTGVYKNNMYFINGRYQNAWVNNDTVDHGYHPLVDAPQGTWYRIRLETWNMTGQAPGCARLSIAYYDEEGNRGPWLQLTQVDNIEPATWKGTIGFSCNGTGRAARIDNILVYQTPDPLPQWDARPFEGADIYDITAETGVVNPPVVAQTVTDALPDLTEATPAAFMAYVDDSLNLTTESGKVLCSIEEYYASYGKQVIPALIVRSEAQARSLGQWAARAKPVELMVMAPSGDLTPDVIRAASPDGKDAATARCEGAEWIRSVTEFAPQVRGGLLLPEMVLQEDLDGSGTVDEADLDVLCRMAAEDTGVTQFVFDCPLTVDQITYFNTHFIAAWGTARDETDVYRAIAAGYHGLIADDPATVYEVYTSIQEVTVSGRPLIISHRGTTKDGVTENTVEAYRISRQTYGKLISEVDHYYTKACNFSSCTHGCSSTEAEHAACEGCRQILIAHHDATLDRVTDCEDYGWSGDGPKDHYWWQLQQLKTTDGGRLNTVQEILEEADRLDTVIAFDIKTQDAIHHRLLEQLLAEHPEFLDNCFIFVKSDGLDSFYGAAQLDAPIPITVAESTRLQSAVNRPIPEAMAHLQHLTNPHNAHYAGFSCYDHSDGNDDFYYAASARGIIMYQSVTDDLNQRLISGEGAVAALTDHLEDTVDWHYFVEAPEELLLQAGQSLDLTMDVRKTLGILGQQTCGFTQITGEPINTDELRRGEAELVYYYHGTAHGETYRVYSAPVKLTVIDPALAEQVEQQIAAIGEVTADSREAVKAARAAYGLLMEAEQALVENYEVLTEAETALEHLPAQPEPVENPFLDVFSGEYYYGSVLWAVGQGITAGTSEDRFSPDLACTRAQVVTFLWRAKGSPEPKTSENPFADVKEGEYYYKAVLWAVENEITAGITPSRFGPEQNCTRAQVVTFLWRTMEKPKSEETNPFRDVEVDAYYHDAVLWAVQTDVTAGTSKDRFSPENPCTRAQVVSFLYRLMAD